MQTLPNAAQNRHANGSSGTGELVYSFAAKASIAVSLLVEIVLLWIIGGLYREELNADGISYLRIAGYYVSGDTDLVICGYWSPLLSWLAAPFLKLGFDPLVAARICVSIGGIVFWGGSMSLIRVCRLPVMWHVIASWLVAFFSAANAVLITPDLMAAGLMCMAIACMFTDGWLNTKSIPAASGALWAVAYLAKAAALPVAIVLGVMMALVRLLSRAADARIILRSLALMFLMTGLLIAPRVSVLSLKYHRLCFSTAGEINHAKMGPPDKPRNVDRLQMPEPGRITNWEEPPELISEKWSPLENAAYVNHQLKLIQTSLWNARHTLWSFDALGVGMIALVLAVVWLPRPWRESLRREPWRWSIVPVACVTAVYAPIFIEQRYLLLAYPCALMASFGLVEFVCRWLALGRTARRGVILIVAASFGVCGGGDLAATFAFQAEKSNGRLPRQLAEKLKRENLAGPVAAFGDVNTWSGGMFLGWFLNAPFLGVEPAPSAESARAAGARLILTTRLQTNVVESLNKNPSFRSLDAVLFKSSAESAAAPLKIYELLQSR